jgi:hypothetical protein
MSDFEAQKQADLDALATQLIKLAVEFRSGKCLLRSASITSAYREGDREPGRIDGTLQYTGEVLKISFVRRQDGVFFPSPDIPIQQQDEGEATV